MFQLIPADLKNNPFEELRKARFEPIAKGRSCAVLVEPQEGKIPIVRTTSVYKNAALRFNDLHRSIVGELKYKFNNAMCELYNSSYKTMGFHSDQALDLADDSYIAIYSCYKYPDKSDRKIIVMDKTTKEANGTTEINGTKKTDEILLKHNSILLFSVGTNAKYLHKIVLDPCISDNANEWIGITYRLSKTYIDPYNTTLRLADENEKQEFYKQKNLENANINYRYQSIPYTISPSDLMPVE